MTFDGEWIASAVAKARQAAREGYFPPLHVRHHEDGTDVQAAGYFSIVGAEPITFKGSRRIAILAELVITNDVIADEVLKGRLPYRSVEIFNVDKPEINSLALLDHEAPFLELPMLMVAELDDATATFNADLSSGGPAFFARERSAYMLWKGSDMAEVDEAVEEQKAQGALFMEDDGEKKKDDDKSEDMAEGEGLDVKAVVKAIKSKSISIGDMDEILAAIQEAQAGGGAEETEEPAPAAVPGGEMMKADNDLAVQFAALRGELEGIKAERAEDKKEQQRRQDVAKAVERLRDRPCGADLESRLLKFHAECGGKPEVFGAYVDALANTVAPRKHGDVPPDAGTDAKVPDFVMKYQETGQLDAAAEAASEWHQAHKLGVTRMTQERWVEVKMARRAGRN